MAQPTPFEPSHEYVTDEGANPNFPGSELDIDLAAIQRTLDETLANLRRIQRDDGALKNGIVTFDSLSSVLQAIFGDTSDLQTLEGLVDGSGVAGSKHQFSSSTAMGDPGAGFFRFNNASPASATLLAFSANTADTGNPDVSDFMATWDDSSSSVKGHLIVRKLSAPSTFVVYAVTGAVTDSGAWLQVGVSHVASGGAWTEGDYATVQFSRTGDMPVINIPDIEIPSPLSNPFYVALGGQSNAQGRGGEASGEWITDSRVEVWDTSTLSWALGKDMQGVEPFDTGGSNNFAIWAAQDIARRHNIVVRLVFGVQGSTEIDQWTGAFSGVDGTADVADGSKYDRTISASNRVQFKKWTDARSAALIPYFDALWWHQGEADLENSEAYYRHEIEFLRDEVEALGSSQRPETKKFCAVVGGLYTGPGYSQQERRATTIETFARENPERVAFAYTADLTGRDDSGPPIVPGDVINHFVNTAYTKMGYRYSQATLGLFNGGFYVSDTRLERCMIPAYEHDDGFAIFPSVLGHRTYDAVKKTDATVSVTKIGGGFRGETYALSGTCVLDLDGNLNQTLGDSGATCYFYMLLNSDQVTINGNGRNVSIMGGAAAAASQVITGGAVRGKIVYQGSVYQVSLEYLDADAQVTIEGGSSTRRKPHSPLEMRQAANAAMAAVEATTSHIWGNTADKTLTTDVMWSALAEVALVDGGTISVDMGTFINATVTLAGNRTLASPSNEKTGQSGCIRIVQNGTGSNTLAYGTDWEFANGIAPVLSTAANAEDLLFYYVIAPNRVFGTLFKAVA